MYIFAILVMIPSVFMAINLVRESSFNSQAIKFVHDIQQTSYFENVQLIDAQRKYEKKEQTVTLRVIGKQLTVEDIARMQNVMRTEYGLGRAKLVIKQTEGVLDITQQTQLVEDLIEKKDAVKEGKKYTIYDEDFNDYIEEAKWWDYDDTMDKPGVYSTDTETLAFSIQVNKDADEEIYYAYYYSKDKEFDKDELSKPVYSNDVVPVEYYNGNIYYNIDNSKSIKKGYYVVIVASDDSLKKPYAVAYCEVK